MLAAERRRKAITSVISGKVSGVIQLTDCSMVATGLPATSVQHTTSYGTVHYHELERHSAYLSFVSTLLILHFYIIHRIIVLLHATAVWYEGIY